MKLKIDTRHLQNLTTKSYPEKSLSFITSQPHLTNEIGLSQLSTIHHSY